MSVCPVGDVLTGVNLRQITSAGDLVAALDTYNIGDTIDLHICRDCSNSSSGKAMSISLTLQEEVT